jgi:hypothetical protein
MNHLQWPLDLALSFVLLGLMEALVKPIAKRWTQRRLLRHAPSALALLDRQLPQLLGQLNGQQLAEVVRHKLESLTGESWSDRELDQLFSLYDPRLTANHHVPS